MESFIESLKNSIISFNPVITSSYAEALAKKWNCRKPYRKRIKDK